MQIALGPRFQHCDGLSRRAFLRAGVGLGGLSLAGLLAAQAQAAVTRRPKSVIYVVLSGGLSHIDTYDPKPEAPAAYRGEFGTIATRLPGVQVCEHFPRQAAMLDRFALLRGVQSVENDHYLSEVYTGLPRLAGQRPAFGSVVSRLHGGQEGFPPYVSLRRQEAFPFEFELPHYAGAAHGPFRFHADQPDPLKPDLPPERMVERQNLLARFDTYRRQLDAHGQRDGMDAFQTQALELITAPKVREAFDLKREPARVLERFGKGKFTHQADKDILYDWDPKPFVLARRLVEAGVRVVTLSIGSWDHHSGAKQHIFESYRHVLPVLDQSLCALASDLEERGLSDDVLLVVLSEFGRTPKLSYPGPGREHWAGAGCVLLHGGGLKMGQVIGSTDRRAEYPREGRLDFQNLMATVYHVLGVDPAALLTDLTGHPLPVLTRPEPIPELIG